MVNYPNGKKAVPKSSEPKKTRTAISVSSANRGMALEKDISDSNDYYLENGLAVVYKRTTPINIVKVDYSHGARITDAYFEKQSTTDYNGVYQGHYVDFEAKNTKSASSFPLSNVYPHQITHLKRVQVAGGIAFFIIDFERLGEIYLLDAKYVIEFYEHGSRKSIPVADVRDNGFRIPIGYRPRIDWLSAFKKAYFPEKR